MYHTNNQNDQLEQINFYIDFWKKRLGIEHYHIVLVRISEEEVIDENLQLGNEFVGIHTDQQLLRAELLHTRDLEEADIIHELVHVEEVERTGDILPDELHYLTDQRTAYLLNTRRKGGDFDAGKILQR